MLGRARLAVPVAVRHRRRDVPHWPVHEGASAGEAAAGTDPGRSRSGAAVAAGPPAAGTDGPDSAELTALADHLTAHGIALEMLAGPLPGIYDPIGTGDRTQAGLAPGLLAESLRGAVLELADGSPGR